MGATFCSFAIVLFAVYSIVALWIRFSGGAGFYNKEDAITKIYNKVDEILYEAKNRGKNIVIWS